jgi:hypothetical protein
MNEKEFAEIAELSYRDICAASGLQAFHAAYAHTNVGGLDHGHIVRAVTDSKQ